MKLLDMNLIIYYHEKNKYSFNTLIGAIENDFEDVKIYFIKKDLIYELKNILKENEKNILCFSFFTTQIWEIKEIVKKVKNEFGNKIICVAGGPHPTGDPEGVIKMGFDLVFKGEGEEAFIEFLKRIYKDEDYKDLKGICFYDGKFHYTGKRKLINLDDYPPFSVKYNKFSPIEITRGCPFSCYFCQVPRIFGGIPRHRSIESICEYVKILKSKNLTDIRFITPNAFSYGSIDGKNLNISKIEDLLFNIRKIIGKKGRIFFGTFPSEVRPEHVNKETVDLILKYTDNDNLVIGGQSGSQRILDLCNRGHKVSDIYNAVEIVIKSGLKANVDFIFGLPDENEEDIRLTIKLMEDLIKMGAKIHAHTFIPLPQTPFEKKGPGKIDKNIKKFISKYIPKGIIYGNFIEQEKISKMISEYLRNKT